MEMCGELPTENLLSAVKEYESVIDTLTTQVEFYSKEQESLRREIITLIKENKLLGQTVSELYQDKSINKELAVEKVESDLVINLKTQLNLMMKEKDAVVELWQTSLKNIDRLEEEMKLFEGRTHGYYSKTEVLKIKQMYENHINDLQNKLERNQTNLEETSKLLQKRNEDLEKSVSYQNTATSQIKLLEDDIKELQRKVQEIVSIRDQHQITLSNKKMLIEELKLKDMEAKRKVTEAIQLIEAACLEKDAAILNEQDAKSEVLKLSKTLTEVLKESSEKLDHDVGQVKSEYQSKIENLQQIIETTQKESSNKSEELERCRKEFKFLENELERIKKGNVVIDDTCTNRLFVLEKNLESTFQKLLLSEKRNLQLESEKEGIKSDLEQMGDCYKRDVRSREIAQQILKKENYDLKGQLKILKTNLQKLFNKNETLKSKLSSVSFELRDKLSGQESFYKQHIAEAVENVEKKNSQVQIQLQSYIESQIALHKKWKKEVCKIIGKFDKQMCNLKTENKSLRRKLRKALNDILIHKNTLNHICTDINASANLINNENINEKYICKRFNTAILLLFTIILKNKFWVLHVKWLHGFYGFS